MEPLNNDASFADILVTSVAAPFAERSISLTLTHRDSEAQFLCGVPGVRTLFQGNSCLKCAIKQAREEQFKIVIQS